MATKRGRDDPLKLVNSRQILHASGIMSIEQTQAELKATATRLAQNAPTLTQTLDALIERQHRRWWHFFFPGIARRQAAERARQRAETEALLDRVYEQETAMYAEVGKPCACAPHDPNPSQTYCAPPTQSDTPTKQSPGGTR